MRQALAAEYGDGEARAMVRLIFHALKGWDSTQLIINADMPASEYLRENCHKILARLREGEPIQYVLGEARFYGMDLALTPDVLIPRPETAELVDLIVSENQKPDLHVLDVGTGSGAIAIALARNLRFPKITAIDISPSAIKVAKENARRLHADIDFMIADIFRYEATEKFDIIVSNPPYIAEKEKGGMERNVLEHEPHSALFVPDTDPLVFYRRIAKTGIETLSKEGRLYFEINPLFATELEAMLQSLGYHNIELIRDSYGHIRFATCRI